METLEFKLNKEYKNIGTISITESHPDVIELKDIKYIPSIMDVIEPLDVDEPIVLARKLYKDEYIIIDGYHRFKNKIAKQEHTANVIILDKYKILRKNGTLFEFIENTVGSTIKFINNEIVIVDGKYYEIEPNEGCGGCGNGWSSLQILSEFVNKDIKVETVEEKSRGEDLYDLYINDKMVAKVDTGYGNGYYGGGFEIFYRN